MSEIKPVAWRQKRENVGHSSPLARGTREGTYTEPLYDQQAIDTLRAEVEALRGALEQIGAIGNDVGGGDWDEIEEARGIAFRALERKRPE